MQPQRGRLGEPHPRASQRLRRGASPVQRLRCQCAAFRAAPARLQPVRADAPGAGRELRVDAHRDLSPAALLQGGQDRAPCRRAGLEAVRRARRLSGAVGMIRAAALAPQPPETQKKITAIATKTSLRPGALRTVIDPSPRFRSSALFAREARPASPTRVPEFPRASDSGENPPKKISNADFGSLTCIEPVPGLDLY